LQYFGLQEVVILWGSANLHYYRNTLLWSPTEIKSLYYSVTLVPITLPGIITNMTRVYMNEVYTYTMR
jgi:hypothetical protein